MVTPLLLQPEDFLLIDTPAANDTVDRGGLPGGLPQLLLRRSR